jgi:DNA-directed RNA polymerase specialized sigma24 family protein
VTSARSAPCSHTRRHCDPLPAVAPQRDERYLGHDSLARTSLNTARNVRAPTALAVAALSAGIGPAYPADVPVVRQMQMLAHPCFRVPAADFESAMVSRRSVPHVDRGYGSWLARLLDRDPDAPWQLAAMLLQDVPPIVRARTHGRNSEAIDQMVDDAVLNYLKHPGRFDPLLADLPHYVAQAATNRLKNWRRHENTQHRAETTAAHTTSELVDPLSTPGQPPDRWPDLLKLMRNVCTPLEQELLLASVDRRPLSELAAKLGLHDAAPDIQRAAVRRAYARIVKRLKRHARQLGLYTEPSTRRSRLRRR